VHLAHYLGLLQKAEANLARAYQEVAEGHADEPDVFHMCHKLHGESERHAAALKTAVNRYGEDAPQEPDRLHSEIFRGTRQGGLGLLRDLQDLYLMAAECDITWMVVGQAAQGARDSDLIEVVSHCEKETAIQLKWLRTRMKEAAPQALIVA
jgi:hypothetical protein